MVACEEEDKTVGVCYQPKKKEKAISSTTPHANALEV
jgi:hypothetical protein